MAHGLDHFQTGMRSIITNRHTPSLTNSLLQKSGLSPSTSGIIDSTLSIAGTTGGIAALRGASASSFRLPDPIATQNKATTLQNTNSSNSIWTSTKSRSSVENAFKHWKDHAKEFPELLNSKQYVEKAHKLFNTRNHSSIKIRANGEILIYHSKSNCFGAFSKYGVPKTMFKPRDGAIYWEMRN